ncbi:MAG: hypothetical protein OXU45_09515 [Candidatus Melainabacteria bacterium]|nr:hypothetical protein [Candidatus Melainabacteria bacterium]
MSRELTQFSYRAPMGHGVSDAEVQAKGGDLTQERIQMLEHSEEARQDDAAAAVNRKQNGAKKKKATKKKTSQRKTAKRKQATSISKPSAAKTKPKAASESYIEFRPTRTKLGDINTRKKLDANTAARISKFKLDEDGYLSQKVANRATEKYLVVRTDDGLFVYKKKPHFEKFQYLGKVSSQFEEYFRHCTK